MHKSNSTEQLGAEGYILSSLNKAIGGNLAPSIIHLPGGGSVQIDGIDHAEFTMCEIYARIGRLKGAQPDKLASDFLKMLLVEKALDQTYKKYFCFASTDAALCVSGRSWLARAASEFGIILKTFPLPTELEQGVREAQERQRMVNA